MVKSKEILTTVFEAIFNLYEFGQGKRDLLEMQERVFFDIVKRSSKTPHGIKNNFSKINKLSDIKNFKVYSYDDVKPIIDKILEGDKDALTYFSPDPVEVLASSSGTAGNPKLAFVSGRRIDDDFLKGMSVWLWYQNKPWRLLKGRTLFYPALPYKNKKTPVPIVNISGYQLIKSPESFVDKITIPHTVWDIEDSFERNFEVAYYSLLANDVTSIGFASALVPYNKWKFILKHRTELIERIRKEGHKDRADYLDSLDENFYVDEVFLSLFRVTTFKAKVNLDDIKTYSTLFKDFDSLDLVEAGVNLSECRATLGIPGKGNPGLPLINVNVYVFQKKLDNGEFGEKLLLNELKEGGVYQMLVFTPDSPFLWNTNDLYKVTSMHYKIPILSHVGKDKYTNFAQEHAYECDIMVAVEKAMVEVGMAYVPFFLKPYRKDGKTGFEFFIESPNGFSGDKNLVFNEILFKIEESLQKNILTYYEAYHHQGYLCPSRISVLSPGEIHKHDLEKAEQNPQYKHKIVHQDSDFGSEFKVDLIVELSDDDMKKISSIATNYLSSKNLI